jgi:hypothetical protein
LTERDVDESPRYSFAPGGATLSFGDDHVADPSHITRQQAGSDSRAESVTEATNRLLGEFSRRDVEPLLSRLEALVNDIDYRYTLDGLALFVNRDIGRQFILPFTLPERVVVDETFWTRSLVFALNRTPRYWVLALSEQPTRLFEGCVSICRRSPGKVSQ